MKGFTKLKTSGPTHLQAFTQEQEGRDSLPVKRSSKNHNLKSLYTGRNLSRTHQAASTVHGEQEANGTLIISHLLYARNQE